MQVKTRVYFSVGSDSWSPEELEARIGMAPTSVMRKASKRVDPPVPASNAWKLDSTADPFTPLWQHLENLRGSIAPVVGKIADVCRGEPTACLQIVREFRPSDEEADLGFWIDESWLAIIGQTGASLDVDEYDYTVER